MSFYGYIFKTLSASILGYDFPILLLAIASFVFFLITISMAKAIKKRRIEWQKNKNVQFSSFLLHGLSRFYTLFGTTISLFPLFGMLGTVFGLLGLDLANGNMDNIKNNFFVALTSTAWGIIFSVIYKFLDAFVADYVEEQIEEAKKFCQPDFV